MRFRLATTGQGGQDMAGGFTRGIQTLAMLPLLRAQAADEGQQSAMKRQLMESQIASHMADAALKNTEASALGGAPDVLDTIIASRAGTDVPTLRNWRQGVRTGVRPTTSATGDAETDAAIGIQTQPAIDPKVAQQLQQGYERFSPALINPKAFKVDDLAQAAGRYQQQDAVREIVANPALAALYGQGFAAVEGKPLVDAIGNTGEVVNRFSGQGGVASPGLRALYGDVQGANILRDKAAASSSYASAGAARALEDQRRQELAMGQRTGHLAITTGPNGEVTVVDKLTRTAQPVLGADGKPVVKGATGGGGKPMTEGQAKANLFGGRMLESDKILGELEAAGVLRPGNIKSLATGVAGAVPIIGDSLAEGAAAATNWTQSSEQQRVEQARRDFVNAVLRRESGAVISDAEFANAEKQYFPAPGDDKNTREQKRRNRQIATTLMLQEVPEGHRYRGGAQPPAAAPAAPTAPEGSWGAPAPAAPGWSIQRVN